MIWCSFIFLELTVFLFSLLLLTNTFFFEPAVRFALRCVEKQSGIAITFEKAEGDFRSGYLKLDQITVVRRNHPVSNIDLKAEQADLVLSLPDLLRKNFVFDSLNVSGLKGSWDQISKGDKLKPKHRFMINDLQIVNADIAFCNYSKSKNALKTVIHLDQARIKPLRSRWAIYDLLFRGNVKGSVDHSPFEIRTNGSDNIFHMENISVDLAAEVWGAPFDWFDSGSVDIRIANKISSRESKKTAVNDRLTNSLSKDPVKKGAETADRSEKREFTKSGSIDTELNQLDNETEQGGMDIDWSFVLRNFHVRTPEGTKFKTKTASAPLLLFFNKNSDQISLNFKFHLDNEKLEFSSSEDLKDLFRLIVSQKIFEEIQDSKSKLFKGQSKNEDKHQLP